ncbi:MAG: hypothetical protein PWR29_445 [Methanolobus sp.]|jgi:ubiquinone/menaquinone biosynthesis C-methylase UbiE|nr:hypothetical protein [Methanolobus sp.]MDK2834017.1 hypothetical protein [Methanolobus sp.]MDK2911488.1 hypothetical protein [Methanolobus sp.]
MGKDIFDSKAGRYDKWYDDNRAVYDSELEAVRGLLPVPISRKSMEIGVGTGRFASALGVTYGLDPSGRMLEIAEKRGVTTIRGVAEKLPLKNSSLRLVLMVTSLCFVDRKKALREIYRVLVPGGKLLIAFIERDSPLGRDYQKKTSKSGFYRNATFHSAEDLLARLYEHGFHEPAIRQALFRPLSEIKIPEKAEEGFGRGSFVVIRTTSIKKE